MPSFITHAAVSVAFGKSFAPQKMPARFWVIAMALAAIPDADVIGFFLGIPYDNFWGHRGFFHAPFLGILLSLIVATVFFRKDKVFSKRWFFYVVFFSAVFASHGLLDAMTNGGKGIALLSPFDDSRIFFPVTPIEVAPIRPSAFFSAWGLKALASEMVWVWLPSAGLVILSLIIRAGIGRFRKSLPTSLRPGRAASAESR